MSRADPHMNRGQNPPPLQAGYELDSISIKTKKVACLLLPYRVNQLQIKHVLNKKIVNIKLHVFVYLLIINTCTILMSTVHATF